MVPELASILEKGRIPFRKVGWQASPPLELGGGLGVVFSRHQPPTSFYLPNHLLEILLCLSCSAIWKLSALTACSSGFSQGVSFLPRVCLFFLPRLFFLLVVTLFLFF